jgi:polysaccharide deacetylase 2 family uncharacterized protein YibQ
MVRSRRRNSESSAPPLVPSRSRALEFASGLVAFLVFALVSGIAILGSPAAGYPSVTLTIGAPQTAEIRRPALTPGQAIRTVGGHLVSDLALIEDSPDGPLPKIAEDGRRPMTAYTRPFTAPAAQKRIAIVMTGLGISQSQTDFALARLPPEITLAFVPSVSGLQLLIDQARGRGHEVVLEIPMEPFDFPDSDPGPNGLMVGQAPEENMKRLRWNLSRGTGYVGISNLLGGRFLGDPGAVTPMLTDVAQRGLLFFDNGRNTNSVAPDVARTTAAPIAVAHLVIDDIQTPQAIELQLSELEAEASRTGSAIGVASVFPVTIDRLEAWSAGLSARGFALSPLTAVVTLPAAQ